MTTLILAALMIGLAGSLHCIGMCGPLVMIIHSGGQGKTFSWWLNQIIYHSGRMLVYASFGVIIGFVGKGFVAYGFQQWLAVISGILLLLMLFVPYISSKIKAGGNVVFQKVRGKFSSLIQNKKPQTQFLLGIINGLLPCGLVYAAMAAALATSSPAKSALFMVVFGLATSPALFAVAGFGNIIRTKIKAKNFAAIRIGLSVLAVLFILRGANLGIPYLSPKVKMDAHKTEQTMECCHRSK